MLTRFFLLCATYIVLMLPTPAAADEDEASIEGQLIYGIAEVGDNAAGDLTDVVIISASASAPPHLRA